MENRKEKLREVMASWWEKSLPQAKERRVKLKADGDLINDIVGPRRAGKTYLMFHTVRKLLEKHDKKSIIYLNFENRRLFPLTGEYFNDLIDIILEEELLEKHEKLFLFLDEVQKISGWENFVRSIFDEYKGRIKIFVSGSTSKLTSSKLSYLLTGRHLTTVVFPLSFREFLEFNNVFLEKTLGEKTKAKVSKLFAKYSVEGGFPESVASSDGEITDALFEDVINRDVAPKVGHKEVIEEIAFFLCSQAGKTTSFTKLSNALKARGVKISVPTLEKYFWLMKESFLFFDTQVFSYKVKDQLQYPRKVYCIDNGFVNRFGFKFSQDRGRMLENLAAIHLFRKSLEDNRLKIFYWKSKEGKEVDFVVKEGIKVTRLIQVCFDVDDLDTRLRETSALIKASKELGCKNLLVLTNDFEGRQVVKENKFKAEIKFVPISKWLLDYS